jgi:cobalt-zinc-cadmium efflux system outer membrane protein
MASFLATQGQVNPDIVIFNFFIFILHFSMLLHIKNIFHYNARKTYALCILYGLCSSAPCSAQVERLTMHQAVTEAIEHNQALQSAKLEVNASKADEITAGLRPNPSLTAIADIGPSQGQSPADKYYGASLGYPFELGGKRDKRIAYAEASTYLSAEQYNDVVRQFKLTVQSAYIDFASSGDELTEARENLALLDSAVALSRYRVKGNDISATELARTEVERDKYWLTTASLENTFRTSRITLLNLLGRPGDGLSVNIVPDTSVFDAIKENRIAEIPSVDSLVGIAETERADIRALRATEKADSANLELQKALAAIDLNVSLDFSRQTGTTYYGTTFSFPLKFFDRNQGEIEKADVRISQAKFNTSVALLRLRSDIINARNDAMNKHRAVLLLKDTVLQKSSNVRNAVEFSYRHGGTSLVDFLDAARTYNEIRTSYYDALADYAKSLLLLNTTIGKDLFYEK